MDGTLTLKQAAKLLPDRPAAAKLVRWSQRGVPSANGQVRLELVGRGQTTAEAVQGFLGKVGRRVGRLRARGRRRRGRKWRERQEQVRTGRSFAK